MTDEEREDQRLFRYVRQGVLLPVELPEEAEDLPETVQQELLKGLNWLRQLGIEAVQNALRDNFSHLTAAEKLTWQKIGQDNDVDFLAKVERVSSPPRLPPRDNPPKPKIFIKP